MAEKREEYNIQGFDSRTQQMIITARLNPSAVDLNLLSDFIIDQAMKDTSLIRDAGLIFYTLHQVEMNRSGTRVFRLNFLSRLQKEFRRKDKLRHRSVQDWICVLSLLCNTFDCLKVDTDDTALDWLVKVIYYCFFRLAKPDALVNTEEVDCLARQLHLVGEQLEKINDRLMDELFVRLRNAYFQQENLSPMGRIMVLKVLDLRAAGWTLSKNAQQNNDLAGVRMEDEQGGEQ